MSNRFREKRRLCRNRYYLLYLTIVLLLSTGLNAGCNVIVGPRGIQSLEVGGVDPPTIEWTLPLNYTGEVIFNWDGEYSGQTEEVWPSRNWI
ncbi:MAG: hypothetical protein ACFFAY_12850, partial [Promethearchaeota archaeon]